MPATEMVVTVAVAAAVLLAAIHVIRLAAAMVLHRTVRKVVDRNPELAESLVQDLIKPAPPSADDRTAVLLIAVGIAMIVASVIIGDPGWMHYAIAGSVFPLIVGTALWLRHFAIVRARRAGRE